MAFQALPFDPAHHMMSWLDLGDLLRLAVVCTANNQRVRHVINTEDPHKLMRDSHRFISSNNWRAALCAIIKTILRPGVPLTYGQRHWWGAGGGHYFLAVHISSAGLIKMQRSHQWRICSDAWLVIGTVTSSPACTNCGINTKRRARC